MTGYLSVGVNLAFAVIGTIVGIYFISRAWKHRDRVDKLTLTMFSAIGLASASDALARMSVLPNYFGRASGNLAIQRVFSDFSWMTMSFLAVATWAYLLHLKPLFYWVSFTHWLFITVAVVVLLIFGGTLLAHTVGGLIAPTLI